MLQQMPFTWISLQDEIYAWLRWHAFPADANCSGGVVNPNSQTGEGVFPDTCLVQCFQNYGLPVLPTRDGPFWIIGDGNVMLQEWQHAVVPVPRNALLGGGRVWGVWAEGVVSVSHSQRSKGGILGRGVSNKIYAPSFISKAKANASHVHRWCIVTRQSADPVDRGPP